MVFKDEVCLWFKHNESHHRLELICSLLNMCLPFELRFIRTCVDELGKRDDIRELDSKANSSNEINELGKVLDERTRSKFILYGALLESNNQTCSKLLYEKLLNSEDHPDLVVHKNDQSTVNYVKEMLLIYTLILHHPAFTFEEKRVIGERFTALQQIEHEYFSKKPWNFRSKTCNQVGISLDSCHPISSPQSYEHCDSGLSIGTEPDVDSLDHVCNSSDIQLGQSRFPSSDNASFDGNRELREEFEVCGKSLQENPSILQNSKSKPTSTSSQDISVSTLTKSATLGSNQIFSNSTNHRDSRSSGSEESGELPVYEVPTTYIYNSNIFDQNINEVSVSEMSISNNVLNISPACMCSPTSCQYYQYPLMSGDTGRKEVPLVASSSEGVASVVKPQSVSLNSPLTSPPSYPYASPPQSLSPDRAPTLSAVENPVTASQAVVTGTTTSLVVSNSSPKLSSRNISNGNCSQPSSPALANNTYRNKSTMIAKKTRYTNDRTSYHKTVMPSCSQVNAAQSETLTKSIANSATILAKNQIKEMTLVQSPKKTTSQAPSTQTMKPEIHQGLNNLDTKSTIKTSPRMQPFKEVEGREVKIPVSTESISQNGLPFIMPPKKTPEVQESDVIKNGLPPPILHLQAPCLVPLPNSNELEHRTGSPKFRSGVKTTEPSHLVPIKSKENNIDLRDSKSLSTSIIPPGKVSIITTSRNPILVPPPCNSAVDKVPSFVTTTHAQTPRPISSIGNSFPLHPSHTAYPPYLPLSMMQGANLHHGPYTNTPIRGHPQAYIPPNMLHGHMKNNKNMMPPPSNMMAPKPRANGGRSGSTSSSSSGSGMGRKKGLSRSIQNKSRSSDSSPSSSQYSSPPQTPSPDHTKDKDTRKKSVKGNHPSEETWDEGKLISEDSPVPPSLPPMILNPMRQRLLPYQPMGFMGYSHNPVFRYSQSLVMGPRPPTPNDKSSREATPPSNPETGPPSSSPPVEAPPYNNYMLSAPPFVTTQFLPPHHGSTLPNGYNQHQSLPPNFMNSDLVYPNQQFMIQSSNCRGHPIMVAAPYPSPYAAPPPPNFLKAKPQSCYNCGRVGHRGSDCKEASIDDLTKRTKVL